MVGMLSSESVPRAACRVVRGGKNEMQEESTSHRCNPIHTTGTVGENVHSHTMRGGGKFRELR